MFGETFRRQLKALNRKNYIIFKRNKRAALCEFLIPVLLIGVMSLLTTQIANYAETFDQKYQFEKGNYIMVDSDPPLFSIPFHSISESEKVAVVGENGTYSREFLTQLHEQYNVTEGYYSSFDEVRKEIQTYESQYDSDISYAMQLDISESKKTYDLKLLSKSFFNGFTPFDTESVQPYYYLYNYVGRDNNIAQYGTMIANRSIYEAKGINDANIRLAYTFRSSYEYSTSQVPDVMDQVFPIFIIIIYTLPFMYLLQRAVEEKQSKTRESMRMMGMIDSAYFTSWFIAYFLQVLAVSIILTLGSIFTMFPGCNPVIIFLMYFLYGLSLFGMCLIFIAIFDTVRTASIGAIVLKLAGYYLRYAFPDSTPLFWRAVTSLYAPLNLYNVNHVMWVIQRDSKITIENLGFEAHNYNISTYLIIAFVGLVFWFLLGVYVTYVVPTEFGTKRHPCFCLIPRRRRNRMNNDGAGASLLIQNEEDDSEQSPDLNDKFERIGNDLRELEAQDQCLSINHLSKVYPNGFKAVNNLSLKMYSGQIFALLGHNGAGKTTTISVLTGLFNATAGAANAFGIDLLNDQDEARKMMGVCPQHNVLFPTLTPKEHFDIFCDFKGVPNDQRAEAIEKCLRNVDLEGQKHLLSKNLSGGQQRKVSVGIAMLGDSKIVLLDEPTSGMDPTARRRLWDLLKNNKEGKIIILTTHYMEEADILGDRIAIMANGDAQCCGSPLFLKKKFGVGYNIVIDKTTQQNAPQIDDFIKQRIPGAIKLSEVSSEISYQLPNAAIGRFKNFFLEMDEQQADLEIKSYGISVTTLEEVFLKVGDGLVEKDGLESTSINADPEQKANDDYCLVDDSVKGMALRILQLRAMIWMRIKVTMRECRVLFLEIFYPTLLIVIASVILGISTASYDKIYALKTSLIPTQQTVFYGYDASNFSDSTVVDRFMNRYYNSGKFSLQKVNDKINNGNLTLDLQQFDDYVMANSEKNHNYFSVFVRDIKEDPLTYDIISFGDATQSASVGYMIQGTVTSLLRDVHDDNDMNFYLGRGPYPKSKLEDNILKIVLTMVTVFSYSIAMGVITASIAGNICKERADSLKHQQIVSGGSKLSYWMSIYFVDLIKFSIPGLAFIIIIAAFNLDIPLYWLFDILCIFAILPFTYLITFILRKESVARNLTRLIHIFLGGILAPIVFGLMLADNTKIAGEILKWVFKFNPTFCFAMGLTQIVLGGIEDTQTENPDPYKNITLDKAGADILFLVLHIVGYFFIIFLIENKFFVNSRGRAVRLNQQYMPLSENDEESKQYDPFVLDQDVKEEEQRVAALSPQQLEVRTYLLNKVYKDRNITKHAVQNVSFGINFGECFALLGINGAGKTTTFKALTGDVDPTSGEVHIGGYDVQNRVEYSYVRKLIGYCPQFDALFTNLTVKEHLEFYAHIKGVIPGMRSTVVNRQLKEMGLEQYKNAHANRLSGGNKRKLSVAMAMIGNPPIVFLDEPSTGMDPKAKRFMWDIIARISTLRKKSAVILTTHSMEEAEALSTKLGIMVGGQFKCFGSAQHIKNKFGDGYQVEIKISIPTNEEIIAAIREKGLSDDLLVTPNNVQDILNQFQAPELTPEIRENGLGDHVHREFMKGGMKIKNFIEFIQIEKAGLALLKELAEDFEYVILIEHYGCSYRVKLSNFEGSVGILFGQFEEKYSERFNIEEYSINQTTLEQIFNNFAKQQYTLSQNSRIFRKQE